MSKSDTKNQSMRGDMSPTENQLLSEHTITNDSSSIPPSYVPLSFSDSPLDLSDSFYKPVHSLKCTVNGIDINLPSSGQYFHNAGFLISSDGISQTLTAIPSTSEYIKVIKHPTSGEYSFAFCDKNGKEFIPKTKAGESQKIDMTPNIQRDIPGAQWDLEKIYNSTSGCAAFKIVRGVDDKHGGAPAELIPTSQNYLSSLYSDEKPVAHLGSAHVTLEQQYGSISVTYYNMSGKGVSANELETSVKKGFDKDTEQEIIKEGNLHPLYLFVHDNKIAFSSQEDAKDIKLTEDSLMISWLRTVVEFPEDKSGFKLMLTPGDHITGNVLPLKVTALDQHIKVIDQDSTNNSILFWDTNDLMITLYHMNTLTAVNSRSQWAEHLTGKLVPNLFELAIDQDSSSEPSFHLTCKSEKHKTLHLETAEFGQIIQRSLSPDAGLIARPGITDAENTQSVNEYGTDMNKNLESSEEKLSSSIKEQDISSQENEKPENDTVTSVEKVVDKLQDNVNPSTHFDLEQWKSNTQHKVHLGNEHSQDNPENYPLWIHATYDDIRSFHSNVGAMYAKQELTYEKAMVLHDKIISSYSYSEDFIVPEGSVDANGNVRISGHDYGSLESLEKMFSPFEQ